MYYILGFHINIPLECECVNVKVAQSCPTLCDPMDCPWSSQGQNTGVCKPFPSPRDLPNPGIKPRSPSLQVDSLPAEPQGKPETQLSVSKTNQLKNSVMSEK